MPSSNKRDGEAQASSRESRQAVRKLGLWFSRCGKPCQTYRSVNKREEISELSECSLRISWHTNWTKETNSNTPYRLLLNSLQMGHFHSPHTHKQKQKVSLECVSSLFCNNQGGEDVRESLSYSKRSADESGRHVNVRAKSARFVCSWFYDVMLSNYRALSERNEVREFHVIVFCNVSNKLGL